MIASELEFFLFRESYEEAAAKRYADLDPALRLRHRGLPHPPDDEGRVPHPRRSATAWTARACRSSSRRARPGRAARDQPRFADAIEMADRHVVYKNGAKEIAAQHGRSISVHGEVRHRRGRLVVPRPLERCGRPAATTRRWPTRANPTTSATQFRGWLGGLMAGARELSLVLRAERELVQAVPARSWAPTAIAWGIDNRTLRLPGRRSRRRASASSAASRAPTPTPTSRSRRRSRAASTASSTTSSPAIRFVGNGYTAADLPRVPHTLVEAIDLFEASRAGARGVRRRRPRSPAQHREAGVGWFNQHVTDWELRRGFERL